MYLLEQIGNIYIYCHKDNRNNIELIEFLKSNKFNILQNKLDNGTIITLGGDGTFLSAIRKHNNKAILGLNFGNRGNLLLKIDDIPDNYEISYININLFSYDINGKYKGIFANEINITGGCGHILDMTIELKNKGIDKIKGDGIIISSPLGSTGYNSSLNGPMLMLDTNLLVITPKACFEPKGKQALVINDNEIIKITNINRILPLEIYADGNKILFTDEKIEIEVKKTTNPVKIIKLKK